jgi:hypothetical protein
MAGWSLARTGICAGAVVAAVEGALLFAGNGAVLHGQLLDPDCYMHLQRTLRMMLDGRWHETLDPRLNAPFGYAIHWTALFDLLLAAGAAGLHFLGLGLRQALLLWGSAISPVLLIAALAVLAWGVKTRLPGLLFLWLVLLLFTQPELAGAFIAGRPDHQSLVLGLLLAQLAWLYGLFDGRTGWRWAVAAGVLAGVQLCASVEGLLTILLAVAAVAGAWLFYGKCCLTDLWLYLAACAVTVFAWLLWENGQFLNQPAYDRVSVVQLWALIAMLLGLGALERSEAHGLLQTTPLRWAAAAVAGVGAAVLIGVLFPDFFLGPWPHLDPVVAAWHQEITELHPLAPLSWQGLGAFLGQMTACVLALPLVIARLRHRDDGPLMLLSLIGFVLFGTLALFQMRWAGEAQAVMLLPWTLTTVRIMQSEVSFRRVPLRSFALAGALLLQMLPGMLVSGPVSLASFTTHPAGACAWNQATAVMGESLPKDSIVMAPLWYGPEILWYSDLRVVAGPYEMAPALADTYAFFDGSEEAAHGVVQRRRIGHVLVCRNDRGKGFGKALAAGRVPTWLEPESFKDGPEEFALFRVAD